MRSLLRPYGIGALCYNACIEPVRLPGLLWDTLMDSADKNKLMLGTLLVGASAIPAGSVVSGLVGVSAIPAESVVSGLLAGVGGNWVAEAIGGVIAAGPPPASALTQAFTRAVQAASARLAAEYGAERLRHDHDDAFALIRKTARSTTLAALPSTDRDIVAVQRSLATTLADLLHGFPDAQVTLLRERLLPTTAQTFQEELARDAAAWRLYHGWLLQRLSVQNAALQSALAAQPAARAAFGDPAALEDRLDDFADQLARLLAELRAELQRAADTTLEVDQSGQEDGTSYGAFNAFETDQPPQTPAGNTRVDQSQQRGGTSYGAFNRFGKTPQAEDDSR